jgi:hypothetical protein
MSGWSGGTRGLAAVGLFAFAAGGTGCVSVNGPADNMLLPSPEPVAHEAILLRGRVSLEKLELDPVMVVPGSAVPTADKASPYLLRGLDSDGLVKFEIGLDDNDFGTLPGSDVQHFMVVAPVGRSGAQALERLELHSADGRLLERHARIAAADMEAGIREGTALAVTSLGGGQIRVKWDAETFPLVQLRDPGRGHVLAVGREGLIELATDAEAVEVAVSEGVRSVAYLYALR